MGFSDRLLDPLWKRGIAVVGSAVDKHLAKSVEKRQASGGDEKDIDLAFVIIFFSSIAILVALYGLVQYTLRHVVTTLALIETPASSVAVTVAEHDDEEANVKLSDKEAEAQAFLGNSLPKLTVVVSKPITSKIRTTIKHITSQAGWTARWRGMGYAMVYGFSVSSLAQFVGAVVPNFPGAPIIGNLLIALLAAPVHMIWTHATIALPGKSWRARWAPATFASYKALAVPALVYEGVQLLVLYMAICMGTLLGLDASASDSDKTQSMAWLAVRGVGVLLLLAAAGVFVILPAHTQLVRVEASMLPDDEDTIVPFDRTFGGKVVPKLLGGSGAIGFMDAWRSFNREARIRVVKLYMKIFAISTVLMFLFVHVLALEVYFFGKDSVDGVLLRVQQHTMPANV
ncbi:hypothetical protein MPH_05568 [Macrophomina phaseolina MS6]|uniref:Uncharacterized protein n=1 Tax=Macrophomina phaseolina (strain MS6) TaxID=1126212 RepID=K2SK50_MACPH|nr:hypothetical protein MPH_05568 [Macrophomina phaseolina MS6]